MARPVCFSAAVAWIAAAIASACSLASLEGLSGGDATDAGAADQATSDAAPVDAVASDATVDAGPARPFCATVDTTALAFCADFDDGRPLPAPFGTVLVAGGGTVAIDGADFRSSPSSLLFTAGGPTGDSAAGLAFTTRPIASEVSVDFEVRVDALGSGSFDVLVFKRADVEIGFQISDEGKLEFDREVPDGDGGRIETIIPIASALGGAWRHVRFEGSPTSGPSTWNVNVLVDGVNVGTTTVPSIGFVGQPDVVLGDGTVFPPSTPWRIRVDNVVVRTK